MRIKYTNLLASLMLLMVFSTLNLFAGDLVDEDDIKQKLPLLANGTTNIGKEYWFTIPPVYENESGGAANFIKIFVTSGIKTKVTVKIPRIGFEKTNTTLPNDVIAFDISPLEGQPVHVDAQIFKQGIPSKIYPGAGINVVADEPILVYVVCRYRSTSDGFLPIPVTGMGKDYVMTSYSGWDPGFLLPPYSGIVAPFDNTKVNITLGGTKSSNFKLDDSRNLKTGQSFNVTLQKGDVYLLTSNGSEPELSGTRVKSNKAIGVVSGQQCSNIPLGNRACDYTVEMDLPVEAWGKVYHLPFLRGRRFNGIIRIFAKEPKTDIFRDGQYWLTLDQGGTEKGKGWTEQRIWPMIENGREVAPKPAVITSTKPIGISFYNTGVEEDKSAAANSDPFAMVMTPIEQYQKEITFNTPNTKGGQGFADNFVNLVYETDSNGLLTDDYEWGQTSGGKFVWQPIRKLFGGVDIPFFGEVNNRKYANKNIRIPSDGVYKIRGKKPFAAYSYGFGSFDSYGYPTSAVLTDLTIPDFEVPEPKWTQNSNGDVLDGTITDMPNDSNMRSNLNYIHMLSEDSLSYNYKFQYKPFEVGTTVSTSWTLNIIDKLKDAKATLLFADKRGNDTIIDISYKAPIKIEDSNNPIPQWTQECNGFILNGTVTDMPIDTNIRSNLNNISMKSDNNESFNYLFQFTPFIAGKSITTTWSLRVVDSLKDAQATLIFADKKGNDTIIVINYSAVKYSFEGNQDFGEFKLDDISTLDFNLVNLSESKSVVYTIPQLKFKNQGFKLEPLDWDIKLPVEPLGSRVLSVTFTADTNLPKNKIKFEDSLSISDECNLVKKYILLTASKSPDTSIKDKEFSFSLSGINPNPVNGDGGTINYSVGFDTKTTITLFDIEGNVVTTLVDNNKMPSGVYSVSIPVDKLNSGIYFYQMESGPFKSTEKLVIQK